MNAVFYNYFKLFKVNKGINLKSVSSNIIKKVRRHFKSVAGLHLVLIPNFDGFLLLKVGHLFITLCVLNQLLTNQ